MVKKVSYTLGGWKKTQKASTRRRHALSSRPRNWSLRVKYLSLSRALSALGNVTRDSPTRVTARSDAKYFLDKYHKRR